LSVRFSKSLGRDVGCAKTPRVAAAARSPGSTFGNLDSGFRTIGGRRPAAASI